MAKLSKGKPKPQPTLENANTRDNSAWNPPIGDSHAQTSSQKAMPPPQARPRVTLGDVGTPNQQHVSNGLPQNTRVSSGKKKRRDRRNRYKNGRDSFSEHTTSVSGDTSTTVESPATVKSSSVQGVQTANALMRSGIADLRAKFKSVQDEQQEQGISKQNGRHTDEVQTAQLVSAADRSSHTPAGKGRRKQNAGENRQDDGVVTNGDNQSRAKVRRPSGASLMPTISAEQQPMFEKEPELFHVYASASENSASELDEPEKRRTKRERTPSYSSSPQPEKRTSTQAESEPAKQNTAVIAADSTLTDRPQIGSDLVILPPQKLSNGRFACPLKDHHRCEKSFADAKGAKRHADTHVNADKYKCHICDKRLAREDSYLNHLEAHKKGTVKPAKKARPAIGPKTDIQMKRIVSVDALLAPDNAIVPAGDGLTAVEVRKQVLPKQDAPGEPEAGPEDVDMNDIAVTDAEEETESDRNAEGEDPNNEATEEVAESGSEAATEDSDSDETQSDSRSSATESSHAQALPVIRETSPTIADLKRKRASPSSQSPVQGSPKARKRSRRDEPAHPLPSVPMPVQKAADEDEAVETTPEATDAESDSASEGEAEHAAKSADIEMKDAEEETEPSSEEDEDSDNGEEGPDAETPADGPGVPDSEDGSEKKEQRPTTKSKAKAQSSQSAVESKAPKATLSRTGTLDGYIERSATRSGSAEAASRLVAKPSKPSVNGPPVSQYRKKNLGPTTSRALQRPKGRENARNVHIHQSDVQNDESDNGNADAEGNAEETTSSEDRPKATTVAHRTSSMGSKARSGSRKVSQKSSRAKNTASTADDGDANEEAEKDHEDPEDSDSDVEEKPQSKRELKKAGKDGSWAKVSKSGLTGRFSNDEIAILHAWRDSFCDLHNMSHYEFNEMMTATVRKDSKEYQPYEKIMHKRDFLDQYYEQLPDRNRRAMIRFRERHFQNVEKTAWTAEDDEELQRLVKELGNKWVEIAQIMGRTQDSVHQRWRHKLNYGKQRSGGDWTSEEMAKLEREVTAMARKQGKDPDDSDLDIKWSVVSERLGSGRTAQQCSNRWRINTHTRKGTLFVRVPHADRIPNLKRGPRTPSKMEKRLTPKKAKKTPKKDTPERKRSKQRGNFKSAEYVRDSGDERDDDAAAADDDDDEEEQEAPYSKEQEVASGNEEGTNDSSSEYSEDDESEADSKASDDNGAEDEQDAEEEDEVMTMIKSKMGNGTDHEQSEDDADTSKPNSDASEVDSSPPPPPQPHEREGLPKNTQQQPSSQPVKTPAVSKNPFNTRTPANALSMTQLHNGTQATPSARPTTGRVSRVPETEERPERPSPAISMRRRPVSSPLDILAQVAFDRGERESEETEAEDDRDEEEGNDTRGTLKSPNSFVSAKSERNEESEDDAEEEETEEEDGRSESGTESGSKGSDESDSSASESGTEDASKADSDDEEDDVEAKSTESGGKEQQQEASQNSFWKSVNNVRNLIPGLSQQSASQLESQSQTSRKGRKRGNLLDALRRAPVDEGSASSDDE